MKFSNSALPMPASLLLTMMMALVGLAGCSGSAVPTPLPPAGVAAGLNTFVLFYTDN